MPRVGSRRVPRAAVVGGCVVAVAGLAAILVAPAMGAGGDAPHGGGAHDAHSASSESHPAPAAKPTPRAVPKAPAGSARGAANTRNNDNASPADAAAPVQGSASGSAADGAAAAPARAARVTDNDNGPITKERAFNLLVEGNARWVADQERSPNTTPSRREQTAAGQTPFAAVLSCADSRVPLECVFDRGVGDLFVVRVAGNVAGESEAGTLEYGVAHLNVPLVVVMGHTQCGAVKAAVSGAKIHGALGALVARIHPAVERARQQNADATDAELLNVAVRENVWQSMYDAFRSSPSLREGAEAGTVRVVGAVYDIASGKVEWIGEHPWQREILAALGPGAATGADQPAADNGAPAHADANTDAHGGSDKPGH